MKLKLGCFILLFLQALTLPAATNVTGISAGFYHTLILKSDGSVWTTGLNNEGQLGDGTTSNRFAPVEIISNNVTAVAAGEFHSLFLKSDASVWGAGWNEFGQLGDTTFSNRFAPKQILSGTVRGIAGGGYVSLFLRSTLPLDKKDLWATGRNSYGEVGDGTVNMTNAPERIVTATPSLGVIAAAGGDSHTLFIKSDGSLWGTGYNFDGELGNGTNTDRHAPIQIVPNNVAAVSGGGFHSLFMETDGSLWAMGLNSSGQLGNGTTSNSLVPVKIISSNVTAIAAGWEHSLFLKSDGSLWAMGDNFHGELGNGTTSNSLVPVEIVSNGVTAIAAGGFHSVFLKSDGSLWGMGWNSSGELGLGDPQIAEIHIPAQILPLAAINGGFETADLLGWTSNQTFSTVEDRVTTKEAFVHSGNYGIQLGQIGSLGFLSQTRPTIPGAKYLLSFWLNSPDGETPNEFLVSWDGVTLMDKTNVTTGWANSQFVVTATQTNTVLQFGFRDDNGYLGLDDILLAPLVQPAIAGMNLAGSNLVINGSNGISGGVYRTLMSANLTSPLSQWTSVATNVLSAGGNFSITATNAVNPNASQQFYILKLP